MTLSRRAYRPGRPGFATYVIYPRSSMGFNPFRPQTRTTADIVIVALAVVATVAGIIWALIG